LLELVKSIAAPSLCSVIAVVGQSLEDFAPR
jgi:hypothetical protein